MTTSTSLESPVPSPRFPPSARDFLAYERLVLNTLSTRQVAEELKISQTRVRQIVRRVADWLEENLPATSETRQASELRLAQHIASDRLTRYLEGANCAWERTHESKYMTTILRLITALSKLPAHPGTLAALAADVSENVVLSRCEGQEAADALHSQSPSPAKPVSTPHPSLGDCSPSPIPAPTFNAKDAPTPPLSPIPTTPSTTPNTATQSARQAFLSPAHLAVEDPDSPTITELKITPQSLGLTQSKHSSRRDRRRLQRLSAKK